ncbi:valine--tRNA ligase [Thermoproteota archaeon]
MEKVFNPKDIEQDRYRIWEESGYFSPGESGQPFSIVIPPPNVTGALHMGHALNLTLQDIIIRYKRMNGFRVLWVPGEDHAGIATQNVVEKQLKTQGISRFDIGREKFVEKVWEWKHEYGSRITQQIRRIGASVDWFRERFTMDEGCAKAVNENFVYLYEKGLVYQGRYIINWCPHCLTALSDIEVNHNETNGSLWVIRYPVLNERKTYVVIATTRPETMFGDTAISVHPEDTRYKDLVGKQVQIPFSEKEIPIIADEHVDPEFGTGAVKVTPAHDINDYEIGRRHNLDEVVVMTPSAIMNENAPKRYQGMDRHACREQLVKDLDAEGLLAETRDHQLSIGHCYRCHTMIEPYLSKQWFVSMKPLAGPAIEVVRSKKIRFVPERYEKLYFDWMENIRDWCISRQIWWGHRIPVWYCACQPDEPIVSKDPITKCPHCGSSEIRQDEDVLDTWFSSALWPFSALGWPEETEDLKTFYPTTLLITAYDILTFWVSRMITMGLAQTDKIPFHDVFIHGLIRDITGKKMSKSLGNVLDPLELISGYGADALRFSLASQTTVGGQDIKFSDEKIESARNFANKIWNVSRYILMILEEVDTSFNPEIALEPKSLADKWILSKFQTCLKQLNDCYRKYNFALAQELLWEFSWNVFCDWYIEISKNDKRESLPVLIYILVNLLKIMHPSMPFITDEIWQRLKTTQKIDLKEASIMISTWPAQKHEYIDSEIEDSMDTVIKVIREIRNLRKQLGIGPGKTVPIMVVCARDSVRAFLNESQEMIKRLAKVSELEIMKTMEEKPTQASSAIVQDIQMYLPLKGVIDINEERARLLRQLTQLNESLTSISKKLSNEQFLEKAPPEVIDKVRSQHQELVKEKQLVESHLNQLLE